MQNLKIPSEEDIDKFEELLKSNPKITECWEEIHKKVWTEIEKDEFNYQRAIELWSSEFKFIKDKFDDNLVLKRNLSKAIGHEYEWQAEYNQNIKEDALVKYELFAHGARWYHLADELIGQYSDLVFRQAQCFLGAAHFGKEAGLDRELLDSFYQRGISLITQVMKGINPNAEIFFTNNKVVEEMKKMSDQIINSDVSVYIYPQAPRNN